ncbi:hypothetical protein ACIPJQ_21555 [Streptomyces griseoviridis]
MRQAQLTREGVTITLDTPSWKKEGGGPVRYGKVEGESDATDLAIALVLEEVDKNCLTTSGALLSLPGRLLFGAGTATRAPRNRGVFLGRASSLDAP